MGAPKTKTVGGGAASPVANDWFGFLSNTLKGGNSPGAGSMQNMYGQMLPNQNAGMPQGGMTTQLGQGSGNYNMGTTYTGMNRPVNLDPSQGATQTPQGPAPFMGMGLNPNNNPGVMSLNYGAPSLGGTGGQFAGGGLQNMNAMGQGMQGLNNDPMAQFANVRTAGGNSGGATNSGYTADPSIMQSGSGIGMGGGAFTDQIRNAGANLVRNNQPQQPNIPGVGGFAGGIESLLNPQVGAMIGNNPFLANLMNYNPSAQLPNAPQWSGTDFQTPDQITANNVGYDKAEAGGTDLNSFMAQFGGDPNQLLKSLGIDSSQFGGQQNIPGLNTPSANFGYAPGSLKDFTTDPSYNAIKQDFARQDMKNIADIRERFGMGGNTMSSGASLGEAQYLAESQPKQIMALQELGRSIQGLDIGQQQTNNTQRLGLMQGQVQDALGRMGISRDLLGQQGSNVNNLLGFLSSNQGQNINAATSIANNNAGNLTNTNIANSGNLLDASKANAANNLNAQGMNANNVLDMNRIRGQESLGRNTFNQNNFSQNSSNALNNQQMVNQFQQFLGSAGLDLQQLAQSGQMGIISQLFSAFQQAAGIGTPQAQTVQTPNPTMQAINAGLGIAGTVGGIMSGNPAMALGGAGAVGNSFNPQMTSLGNGGYFSGPAPSLYGTGGIR